MSFNFWFCFFVGIPIGITNSTVRIKICQITEEIKKYKSVVKWKRKQYDKIILLAKTKLNIIEILISRALIVN